MALELNLKEKFQRFGAAMFVPVLLFSFSGLIVGLTIIFKDRSFVGDLANPEGVFYRVVSIIEEGGAHGVMKAGNGVQVIVGLSVAQVKTKFEQLLKEENKKDNE